MDNRMKEWYRNSALCFGATATASAQIFASQFIDPSAGNVILMGGATVISSMLSSGLGSKLHEHQQKIMVYRKTLLSNDLHTLIAEAVRATILNSDLNSGHDLDALAEAFLEEWENLLTTPGFRDYVTKVTDDQMVTWFHQATENDPHKQAAQALKPENWEVMIKAVGSKNKCLPEPEVIDAIAQELMSGLPSAVLELLKEDFCGETKGRGRAYAGYTIQMLSQILSNATFTRSQVDETLKQIKTFINDQKQAELQNQASHSETQAAVNKSSDELRQLRQLVSKWVEYISIKEEKQPTSLAQASVEKRVPWMDAPFSLTRLPVSDDSLIGRSKDKARLTRSWNNTKTQLVQIIAPPGVGKTQLVEQWGRSLIERKDHGAVRAFDWSFFSLETEPQVSVAEFFDHALRWFGESEPDGNRDLRDKGERLAHLVKAQPTLLILDGLELLQHPPGPHKGELTNESLKIFLNGLFTVDLRAKDDLNHSQNRPFRSLCIITSRVAVTDFNSISEPQKVTIELDPLTSEYGAILLNKCGVTGDDKELEQASLDYDGHALSLILLGTYLKARFGGDIIHRNRVKWHSTMDADSLPALNTDELYKGQERFAKHAREMINSYVYWFENVPEEHHASEDAVIARVAVCILRLMGLFNRPADQGCLKALKEAPLIQGLTEDLFEGNDRSEIWHRAVERLRSAKLITGCVDQKGTLDAHPIIREHFAMELANSQAGREAHRRLYEHLKNSVPSQPDTFREMIPLFHAAKHACNAGDIQGAFSIIYFDILREHQFYALRVLGLGSLILATLKTFFVTPWTEPRPELSLTEKCEVFHTASVLLETACRMDDAIEPGVSAINLAIENGDYALAANLSGNVSHMHMRRGELQQAVSYADQAIALAEHAIELEEKSECLDRLKIELSRKAYVLLQLGDYDSSKMLFQKSEKVLHEKNPKVKYLFSFPGVRYCEYLLEEITHKFLSKNCNEHEVRERLDEILDRVEYGLQKLKKHISSYLATSLFESVRARVEIFAFRVFGQRESLSVAQKYADNSLDQAERSSQHHWIPHILMVHAEIKESDCQYDDALAKLESARDLTSRRGLRLFEADCLLQMARTNLAKGEPKVALGHLEEFKLLCNQYGYNRRLALFPALEAECSQT